MKLTEELNAILTESERSKFVHNGELVFNGNKEALKAFMPRYFAALNTHIIKNAAELKKLYPEAFGEDTNE